MTALPQTLAVVGLILAAWIVVPGTLLVVLVRVWRHCFERTDGVPSG